MIVSIHQPNFIPWLGYFYKIAQSDIFVLLDDVQFSKNSFINRNRIKTPQGEMWLTLPVKQSGNFGQKINECEIQQKELSVKKVLNSIKLNYVKAPYFQQYIQQIENILNSNTDSLEDINCKLIFFACESLEIGTKIIKSSTLNIRGKESTERLIEICKNVNAKTYLSGKGGLNYQEEDLFTQHNIQLKISQFSPPNYNQMWGNFIGGLSIIDILLNCGPDTKKFI